ncbi:DUF4173 domain-containing protein [Tabrizicola piscis]|uniref:DUF4173 domain-containing protein n=2 Tax=Tabrizicola piscis TaxID=2494374 RepID=A0A3S8U5R5_9RHOB|nr:DUF4173 domain-containing protein [Tabrizicola piscis]
MPRPIILNGVPSSLAADAWWLSAIPDDPGLPPTTRAPSGSLPRGLACLMLVLLADLLFWRAELGMSAALFAAAIFAVVILDKAMCNWQRPAVLLTLAALPVFHHMQPLSFAFLTVGLVTALVWAHHPDAMRGTIARSTVRFLSRLPWEWVIRLNPVRPQAMAAEIGQLRGHLRNWGFPVGGGLVILTLLMEANPVLSSFLTPDLDLAEGVRRLVFWAGIALLVAPFLVPLPLEMDGPRRELVLPSLGLNSGSVIRALFVFNLLIAIQSVTDLSILLGGATLPPGMTLAEFAHRGAYPLLATAILAGAFALAARPFLGSYRLIRPLLLLWLGQNVILCAAAAIRLELYIESFSLTYLRLYALIWMALVAAGLGLIFWQVLRGRPNGWLLLRSVALGAAVLYACCFVNFAQIIAAQNLRKLDPDRTYLCALGPLAAGPILESGLGTIRDGSLFLGDCRMGLPRTGGWREWGFRTWAASRYVQRVATAESPR